MRSASLLLALFLLVALLPAPALAGEASASVGAGSQAAERVVEALDALPQNVAAQQVEVGFGPTLPAELTGQVDGAPAQAVPVTWASGDYQDRPGSYTFTAALGQGYTLAPGASLPSIAVQVAAAASSSSASSSAGGSSSASGSSSSSEASSSASSSSGEGSSSAGEVPGPVVIAAFEALAEDVAAQQVEKGTAETALTLPGTLAALDEDGGPLAVEGVAWESRPAYDGEAPGEYAFTAALPESYTLAEGAEAPAIAVTVQEEEGEAAPLVAYPGRDIKQTFLGGTGTIVTGSTISFSKDGVAILPDPDGTLNVPADADAFFQFFFKIPANITAQIREDDYYVIDLPPQFKVGTPITNVPLESDNGVHYANMSVTTDGKLILTFTADATGAGTLTGEVHFNSKLNADNLGGAGNTIITYPTEVTLPPVHINVKPVGGSSIDKQGVALPSGPNPTSIRWTIDVNKGLDALINPIVSDTLPGGVTLPSNISDFTINELNVDLKGNPTTTGAAIAPVDFQATGSNSFTLQFMTGLLRKAARITFVTPIEASAVPALGGTVKFTNQAGFQWQGHNTPIPASATVAATFTKPLQKSPTAYDPTTQTVTWQVLVTPPANNPPSNYFGFSDIMNKGPDGWKWMKFLTGPGDITANTVTYDANGRMVVGPALTQVSGSTPGPGEFAVAIGANGVQNSQMDVMFNGATTQQILLTYKTQLLNPQDPNITGFVFDNHLVGIGYPGSSQPIADGSVSIRPPWVTKSIIASDPGKGQVQYQAILNRSSAFLTNAVYTDTYDSFMWMGTGGEVQYTVQTMGGTVLREGRDYDFAKQDDENSPPTFFTLTFKGDYNPLDQPLKVTYTLYYRPGSASGTPPTSVTNHGHLDANEIPGGDGSVTFQPKIDAALTGGKEGVYNPVDKTITWRVWVNYTGMGLQHANITDAIPAGQSYVAGSVRVYDYTVTGSNKVRGTLLNYSDSSDPYYVPGLSVIEPNSPNGTLQVNFPDQPIDTGRKFWVEFQTSLEGEYIAPTYKNTAKHHNEINPDIDLPASVSVGRGGELISKAGSQGDDGYAWWTLEVNASQSTLKDAVITDTLSANQNFIPESLVVQGAKLDSSFKLVPDGTTLTLGTDYSYTYTRNSTTNVIKITLLNPNPITRPYLITFKCSVYVDDGELSPEVTNQASLNGFNVVDRGDNTDSHFTIDVNKGGGTIKGSVTTLPLAKNAPDGTPLAGAVFQLYDRNGDPVGDPATTNAKGRITWHGLISGRYTIKEVTPPPGYNATKELTEGVVITLRGGMDPGTFLVTLYNVPSGVNFSKQAADGTLLPGATFRLEQQGTGGNWKQVRTSEKMVTDKNGWIRLKALAPGQYRFIETQAPAGYILNTEPRPFYFEAQSDGTLLPVEVKAQVNYQGRVEVHKLNEDGKTLKGVTFELHQGGAKLKETKTDAAGVAVFDKLTPGHYTLKETSAPSGYVVDPTPVAFTVPEQYEGVFPVISFNFVNHKVRGNVNITKVGIDGVGLAGAVFRVYDRKTHKVVVDEITTHENGRAVVVGLPSGDYYLREVTAPPGHVLDKTRHYFTVDAKKGPQHNALTVTVVNHPDANHGGYGGGGGGPATGDLARSWPWLALLVLAGAGLGAALWTRRRRKAGK